MLPVHLQSLLQFHQRVELSIPYDLDEHNPQLDRQLLQTVKQPDKFKILYLILLKSLRLTSHTFPQVMSLRNKSRATELKRTDALSGDESSPPAFRDICLVTLV